MKKRINIILLVFVMLFLTGCAKPDVRPDIQPDVQPDDQVVEKEDPIAEEDEIVDEPEYITFTGCMSDDSYIENLNALEKRSCAIVSGKVVEKREILTENDPLPPSGVTITTLQIDTVYKTDNGLEPGSKIEFLEYYWTQYHEGKPKIYTYDYYVPAKKGGSYLLFFERLSLDDRAEYTPTVLWMGKYPISQELSEAWKDGIITAQETGSYGEINGQPGNYVRILNEIMASKQYSLIP